jgi:membrane protease YdiL (CAAX protease family)
MPGTTPPSLSPAAAIRLAIVFEGGLLMLAVLAGALTGTPALRDLRLHSDAIALGIVATLPTLLLLAATRLTNTHIKQLHEFVRDRIIPLFRGATTTQLALVSMLAGLGEEALFRGLLQNWLTALLGPWPGLVAASVAFGMAHYLTRSYAVMASLFGLYLGGLYALTGNLLVPVVVHALYDFIALSYLLREDAARLNRSRNQRESGR